MEIELTKLPEIIVFAGPNGSGKSTLTDLLRPDVAYVNADEIKKSLHCNDMDAALIAEKQRESFLSNKNSFCFETVLSTDRNIKLLQKAKSEGYFIRCYYVLTVSPLINVSRVFSRVKQGGHPVPIEKITKRFTRALELVPKLVSLCDVCHMYDNSGDSMLRIFKKRKTQFFCDPNLFWPLPAIEKLTGIHEFEQMNLN